MLSNFMRFKQKGVTLIEIMLVLAIISIILVTATRYYRTTVTTQRTNETLALLTNIVGGMEVWRGARFNYAGINVKQLKDAGLLPVEIAGDGENNYKIPWLNEAFLSIEPRSSDTSHAIATIAGMPAEVCENLADRIPFMPRDGNSSEHISNFFGECGSDSTTFTLTVRAQGDSASKASRF